MPQTLSETRVRKLRMRAQRLSGRRPTTVHGAVLGATALQAQDVRASRLAVRPRSTDLDVRAVLRACNEERSVVRTWAMRGTLHMVPAEDVRWLVGLLGPGFAARGRRRRHELGLDDDLVGRALGAVRRLLARSAPLTRAELVDALARSGVAVGPKGQAPAHLLSYAALQGVVCRGPDRADDEPTYVLLDDWVAKQRTLEGDAALAELTRRHLTAYGPAGPADLAAWSGMTLGQARRGYGLIAGEIDEVGLGEQTAWALAAATADEDDVECPCVRLLPAFDAYLLGYRRRDFALPPRAARRIQAGGGWIHPAVVVDGRVVGAWRQRREGPRLAVVVEPFEPLEETVLDGLEGEVADVGRFLGTEATLAVDDRRSPEDLET